MVLAFEVSVRVLIGQLRVVVVVAQHGSGVALSVKVFGKRKRSGVAEDSGCQEGRAPVLSEASHLKALSSVISLVVSLHLNKEAQLATTSGTWRNVVTPKDAFAMYTAPMIA